MIKELLDGLTSRLKGVGEKGEVPPPGGIPPSPDDMPPIPTIDDKEPTVDSVMPEVEQDFSTLLGGGDNTEMENKIKSLEDKSNKLEASIKETLDIAKNNQDRLNSIDQNMKKFLSLYELVTNQINPFVDTKQPFKQEKALLSVDGETVSDSADEQEPEPIVFPPANELEKEESPEQEPQLQPELKKPPPKKPVAQLGDEEQVMFMQSIKEGSASFVLEWITSLVSEDGDLTQNTKLLTYLLNLGWITPKAYEALMSHLKMVSQTEKHKQPQPQKIPLAAGMPSGFQQPPTNIPGFQPPSKPLTAANDMDSLMEVLEWIKYLVDKVGSDEATEILKYLVQLGWITPDAHKALLKYIEKTLPEDVLEQVKARKQPTPQQGIYMAPDQIPSPDQFMQKQYQVPIGDQKHHEMPPSPIPAKPQLFPPMPSRPKRTPQEAIIPLTELGSDIDSLAVVLEWIRYLVDRAGTQGARDIFNYYFNIGWLSQQVYQQLGKYVEGIKSEEEETVGYQPTVEDHATSLFFISKLKNMELSEEDIQNMLGN